MNEKPGNPRLFGAVLLLSLLAFFGLPLGAFELRSLSVGITMNADGSAHVEESIQVFITGAQSRQVYEDSKFYNDLSTWRDRLGLAEIRQHVSRAEADIVRFRIRPDPVERCNALLATCFATITFDYDALAASPKANQSGLVIVQNYKPRTSLYLLNPQALSFETSKGGDIIIPKGTSLSIAIPQDSKKIFFSRAPDNLRDSQDDFLRDSHDGVKYYAGSARSFEWADQTLSQFEFSFEREESLETEVLQFFQSMQQRISSLLFSAEGPAIILLLAVVSFSVFYLNHMRKRAA